MKRALAAIVLAVIITLLSIARARAEEEVAYTTDDTLSAIAEVSDEFGIAWARLYAIVWCESRLEPYAIGRRGEIGAVQLAPWGELRRFYAWGYLDPHSPYQSVRFLAQRLLQGGARAWACA